MGDQDGNLGTEIKAIMRKNPQDWTECGLRGWEDGATVEETGKAVEVKAVEGTGSA